MLWNKIQNLLYILYFLSIYLSTSCRIDSIQASDFKNIHCQPPLTDSSSMCKIFNNKICEIDCPLKIFHRQHRLHTALHLMV